jgi:Ser/Thr protein kinase RdoA (MazF antagonist)
LHDRRKLWHAENHHHLRAAMKAPTASVKSRAARILGWEPETWRPATGGYTAAARFVVTRGAQSAFVKAATQELTARLLKREIGAYQKIAGRFMPRLIGYDLDETEPLLIIEDLAGATWPPPWTETSVALVLDQMATMHATPVGLEHGGLLDGREAGWPTVAADPAAFLSLGLVSRDWLERALPALLEAEAACELHGDALTHLDLRSDNICLTTEGVKFIDWAEACRSSAKVDLGFFLPSLAYEGGPRPEDILPGAPEVAAMVAGFFAARAGLPIVPDAPYVRRVQLEQLETALPWAQRALGLPPF